MKRIGTGFAIEILRVLFDGQIGDAEADFSLHCRGRPSLTRVIRNRRRMAGRDNVPIVYLRHATQRSTVLC